MLKQKYGITIDSDAAADIANTACQAPTSGVGYYNTEQALQQRYPNINVATVTGAGVLAYCPGRLP